VNLGWGDYMKPRGNTKVIIKKVGDIQNLIGEAKNMHYDDKSQVAFAQAQQKLQEAFDLCLEIRNLYDPI
jgi:uncharacterized protein YydD (DUF2326 family)